MPAPSHALPATDGVTLWLPATLAGAGELTAIDCYRAIALQQAMRAHRGGAARLVELTTTVERDLYLLLEAYAADEMLVRTLPGVAATLNALRRAMLAGRPPMHRFPEPARPLEALVRTLLRQAAGKPVAEFPIVKTPQDAVAAARRLAADFITHRSGVRTGMLWRDAWTGELRVPSPPSPATIGNPEERDEPEQPRPRSARLARRPNVRPPKPGEDEVTPGAWMVQTSAPHEQAEDPMGLQRPSDRDETTAAEEFADALSELREARLIATPGRPKEVLVADDAPDARAKRQRSSISGGSERVRYPEWDYRIGAYREPGATVKLLATPAGPQKWVDDTLAAHRSRLDAVRRRFDMLRARRIRLRKQMDGEEVDLDAYIESYGDFRAGLSATQALYQTYRRTVRDVAVMLLIDVSGSTDGWISGNQRIIDVARTALLLVAVALQGAGEPYSILAFSGESADGVTVRAVKSFEEPYGGAVARRIAALEPERYTRVGAAIRHATALLMRQTARHRLLLLLSDGKPNDVDDYEGRYGIEDARQSVTEAKLQGISPFCLTIDRHGASYLPHVFGAHHYALLPRPELLPSVLLDWMKRLLAA